MQFRGCISCEKNFVVSFGLRNGGWLLCDRACIRIFPRFQRRFPLHPARGSDRFPTLRPAGLPCGCVHPASVPSRYTVRDRIFQIANHGAGGTVCPDVAAVFGLADFHLYTTFDELQEGTLCGGALKQLAQCFELEWSNATL